MTGSVLSSEEITARVADGDIFSEGTFDERNLRAASYDLRIATDLMRIPSANPDEGIFERDQHNPDPIKLQPGDVAFVTSVEEFQVPWDIAGNIGVRFGLAGKGVLVHTGLLIHPGFGIDENDQPHDPGLRLHFLLANLSPREVIIVPKETVASVQFFEVAGNPVHRVTAGRDDLEELYIKRKAPLGLGYLGQLQTVGQRVDHLHKEVHSKVIEVAADVNQLHREVDARLERLERSSRDLIMFGVYIVAAAFLGVVFTEILNFLSDEQRARELGRAFKDLHLTMPIALLGFGVCLLLIFCIRWGLQLMGHGLAAIPRAVKTRWSEKRKAHAGSTASKADSGATEGVSP